MSIFLLIAITIAAFIGLCSTCLLLIAVGAWLIRQHRDEHQFRQELRLAHRIETHRLAKDFRRWDSSSELTQADFDWLTQQQWDDALGQGRN